MKIDKIPESAVVNCPSCASSQKVENQEYYFPRLIMIQGIEKGQEFVVVKTTSLGRGTYNTIQLRERKASREHAIIKFENGTYWIEDRKSGNGTFVNGKPVTRIMLQDKDIIRIADAVFMFRDSYRYLFDDSPAGIQEEDGQQISQSLNKEAVLTEKKSDFERTRAEVKFDAQHSFLMNVEELKNIADVEKANTKLRILYEVNHAISSLMDLQELLTKILDVVFQYIPAERGAILLYEKETESLQSSVTKVRDHEEASEEQIKISKTMMDRVVSERVSFSYKRMEIGRAHV